MQVLLVLSQWSLRVARRRGYYSVETGNLRDREVDSNSTVVNFNHLMSYRDSWKKVIAQVIKIYTP